MNGQEKSTELNPDGNSYTAEFWQYDARLVRRWNVDPKPVIGISPYSCFAGNPVSFNDPKGDTTGIRTSSGELLGTHYGKTGNYVLVLNKESEQKWIEWRKNNFKDLNAKKLSEEAFMKLAVSEGQVFDINSAKEFYFKYSGQGTVDKIYGTPIVNMTNIMINGKKSSQSDLLKLIAKEKLGPEYSASWMPNQKGIMQVDNNRTNNDLSESQTGSNLLHLHPNTSRPYIITFDYKEVSKITGETKMKTDGFVELRPYAATSEQDASEARKFGTFNDSKWNTVIQRGIMHFYTGFVTKQFEIKF